MEKIYAFSAEYFLEKTNGVYFQRGFKHKMG